ncbi:MAG TPA: TauD/TfdA family dioxygenase [Herpetosiphonaceae bacterium]
MQPQEPKKPSIKGPGSPRRQAVNIAQQEVVKLSQLQPDQPLPLLIQPAIDGVDLLSWAGQHREQIEGYLLEYGGILFRGFNIKAIEAFEQVLVTISNELLEYSYRSTPRTQVSGRIYTSTEYPADQSIPMHNEMAYTTSWPMKIGFFAVTVAEQGGETPIADSRKVFAEIDPLIRERFARTGVMYVRNYGGGIDLPWQEVFQTSDKAEVEDYCRSAGIRFEWKDGDRLRTSQVCQAVAKHPKTGASVWFNQAHLFHVSALLPEVRDTLLANFKEEDLPRNTYYGDGSPIEAEVLDEIRRAFDRHTVVFPWQEGDIMILDNMLTAHGRMPFVGARKTVVGMAELIRQDGL